MADVEIASSPRKPDWLNQDEEVEWYKSQYANMEQELIEFQGFSRELEKELEKELEMQEKVQDDLKKKNEGLKYEVDEWKTKFRNAKEEANQAQTHLQKEITELREKYRTSQIRIREMEVSNDDFERNERIVKSSLDDLESKYNMAIERNAMNESEIQTLEQEREDLRIELQRVKDELAELKVEAEISQEKYLMAKQGTANPRFQSPMPEAPSTPTSISPTPRRSRGTPNGDFSSPTPPSPPISETSTTSSRIPTPHDQLMTPRPSHYKSIPKKTPSVANLTSAQQRRLTGTVTNSNIPVANSKSLTQIRGLIGQMQRLEKRVQTARSKMPPPVQRTPPRRSSPHIGGPGYAPPLSVTMRRVKRPSSTTSSVTSASVDDRFNSVGRSFAGQMAETINGNGTPSSRPSSRTSSRLSFSTAGQSVSRPSSRASTSGGSQIPLPAAPDYTQSTPKPTSKPRSSIGGLNDDIFATPRRGLSRAESGTVRAVSGTPMANGSAIPRRKSMQTVHGGAGSMAGSNRRISSGVIEDPNQMMPPPPPMPPILRRKKLNGVGET
ncbi:hypothetical protein AA313_de0202457 [Arthrobotrys entomopaga]|nr:hypothetical protein AA313_de0202457 [Arthrobotrys entomopaga]